MSVPLFEMGITSVRLSSFSLVFMNGVRMPPKDGGSLWIREGDSTRAEAYVS